MKKNILIIGIFFLFFFISVTPMAIGFYINRTGKNESVEEIDNNFNSHHFNIYDYPEWYSTKNQIIEQKKSLQGSSPGSFGLEGGCHLG